MNIMLNNRSISHSVVQPVVPVVDLINRQVVRAFQGQREYYQPISSLLSASSRLRDVIDALLTLYPFATIYIADLDAISGKTWQRDWIKEVLDGYPYISIWLDAGAQSLDLLDWHPRLLPVVGSESLSTLDQLAEIPPNTRWLLSLDFFEGTARGPAALFETSQYWPERVIIMSLQHVGSYHGPDWTTLRLFQQRHPAVHFIAAGGVRDARDVIALTEMGIEQCLVASALHDGKITRDDLFVLSMSESG